MLGDRILPIPVAERSKARVCGPSLAGVAGLNLAGCMDFVWCVLYSKDKRKNGGQSRQKNKNGMKYRVQKNKENRGGEEIFLTLLDRPREDRPISVQWITNIFPGYKAARSGINHPNPT